MRIVDWQIVRSASPRKTPRAFTLLMKTTAPDPRLGGCTQRVGGAGDVSRQDLRLPGLSRWSWL